MFKGKLLAFLTRQQMSKFQVAVAYAGGKAVVLDEARPNHEHFRDPAYILVKPNPPQGSTLWKLCEEEAHRAGLSPVPDSQIGLAILLCSTELYCNPAKRPVLLQPPAADEETQGSVSGQSSIRADKASAVPLAPETQLAATASRGRVDAGSGPFLRIPETLAGSNTSASQELGDASKRFSRNLHAVDQEQEDHRTTVRTDLEAIPVKRARLDGEDEEGILRRPTVNRLSTRTLASQKRPRDADDQEDDDDVNFDFEISPEKCPPKAACRQEGKRSRLAGPPPVETKVSEPSDHRAQSGGPSRGSSGAKGAVPIASLTSVSSSSSSRSIASGVRSTASGLGEGQFLSKLHILSLLKVGLSRGA